MDITLQLLVMPWSAKLNKRRISKFRIQISPKSNQLFLVTKTTSPKNLMRNHPQLFEYSAADKPSKRRPTSKKTKAKNNLLPVKKGWFTMSILDHISSNVLYSHDMQTINVYGEHKQFAGMNGIYRCSVDDGFVSIMYSISLQQQIISSYQLIDWLLQSIK